MTRHTEFLRKHPMPLTLTSILVTTGTIILLILLEQKSSHSCDMEDSLMDVGCYEKATKVFQTYLTKYCKNIGFEPAHYIECNRTTGRFQFLLYKHDGY